MGMLKEIAAQLHVQDCAALLLGSMIAFQTQLLQCGYIFLSFITHTLPHILWYQRGLQAMLAH